MYDYVFVTPLPSFYKINLYNELAKKINIFVIFIGESSKIRTEDFIAGHKAFPYVTINRGAFENKFSIISCLKLMRVLFSMQYKKIVVGGWDFVEYWLCLCLNPKEKNAVIVESTPLESNLSFIKRNIKRLFFQRISLAFPSGKLQGGLLEKLGFRNSIVFTGGVGIFYRAPYVRKTKDYTGRFLYIGRLSAEKNVEFLVDFFNRNSQYQLTIVGQGPLKEPLLLRSKENINIVGHIANEKINEVYLAHDVLILPSKSEPWGLVVDEALYFNLPVIVSKNVGCASELVNHKYNGIILDELTEASLAAAINDIKFRYDEYQKNVRQMDFIARDKIQVNAYLEGLK